ncbi:unnamed protein product, partial [Mesorhabditis belari]|uniref:Uncharacterized protein n=1 Tax=Mesorhabditis belari TaxID=2138241 RepID=A0AAF3FI28_9BILA
MDVFIFLLFIHQLFYCTNAQFSTITDILENTNKRLPNQNTSNPLGVRLGFYLESIGNFRAEEMSFDVDMYAYMSWTDWRLRHNFPDYVLVNDDNIRQQMWLPDLYFANAIKSKAHDVTVPNFNMFIANDGTVAYSCRFTMQISCNLELQNYPMDVQTCGIQILSYAYIAKQVNVSWFDTSPIRFNPSIGLPEFNITAVTPSYCNGTYRYAVMSNRYKVDVFSCLLGDIHLARSIGYNLVQSFIPTGLIVMISWVSFWIDRRAVPARVTLSFTTLVSLTTLGNGLRFGLPQVSYAKAIDYWYGACMLFVFMALLEFAIINSYMRKAEKYGEMAKKFLQSRDDDEELFDRAVQQRKKPFVVYATDDGAAIFYNADKQKELERQKIAEYQQRRRRMSQYRLSVCENAYATMSKSFSRTALYIDKACRYGFPLIFVLFNLFYWWFYLCWCKSDPFCSAMF